LIQFLTPQFDNKNEHLIGFEFKLVLLIVAQGGDSSGTSTNWKPRRNVVTRRLKPCPRKASAWSGNQHFLLCHWLSWLCYFICFKYIEYIWIKLGWLCYY